LSEQYDPFTDAPPSADVYSDKGESLDPKPQPEPESYDGSRDSLRELAESRTSAELNTVVERSFHDGVDLSKPADASRPVSAKFASESLTAQRDLEAQLAQAEVDQTLAQQVDDFRADQVTPGAQPEQSPVDPQLAELQLQAEEYVAAEGELDRLLNSVADENTRQRIKAGLIQGYEKQQAEIEQVRKAAAAQAQAVQSAYEQAAAEAMLRGEALLLSQAPEIASVPREQRLLALDILQKQNPQRAAQIRELDRQIGAHLQTEAQHLQAAQQQRQQAREQQHARAAQAFQQWGAAEDAKVDKLLATETPANQYAIKQEAVQILREDGLTDEQMGFMWQNDATFRSATAQKMLMREAKARIAERGVRAARVTPVPHVARPGVSEDAVDRSAYADLSREYRGKDLSVRDAARLLIAKRASR
jgi:hypothetical protein